MCADRNCKKNVFRDIPMRMKDNKVQKRGIEIWENSKNQKTFTVSQLFL